MHKVPRISLFTLYPLLRHAFLSRLELKKKILKLLYIECRPNAEEAMSNLKLPIREQLMLTQVKSKEITTSPSRPAWCGFRGTEEAEESPDPGVTLEANEITSSTLNRQKLETVLTKNTCQKNLETSIQGCNTAFFSALQQSVL